MFGCTSNGSQKACRRCHKLSLYAYQMLVFWNPVNSVYEVAVNFTFIGKNLLPSNFNRILTLVNLLNKNY
jgi:hypothetical protein